MLYSLLCGTSLVLTCIDICIYTYMHLNIHAYKCNYLYIYIYLYMFMDIIYIDTIFFPRNSVTTKLIKVLHCGGTRLKRTTEAKNSCCFFLSQLPFGLKFFPLVILWVIYATVVYLLAIVRITKFW